MKCEVIATAYEKKKVELFFLINSPTQRNLGLRNKVHSIVIIVSNITKQS